MIEIKNLTTGFDGNNLYENFNLKLEDNKITVILGESGCGKTTLLKCIANLQQYSGEINLNENDKISFIFQENRLVKTLNVLDNILLLDKDVNKAKSLLKEVGLENKENSLIKELSGGEKRRVSLVRGLIYNADILLLDEPFNSLDIAIKEVFYKMLKEEKKHRTIVLVTHDIIETINIADRIVLIDKGKILMDIKDIEKQEKTSLYEKIYKELLSCKK